MVELGVREDVELRLVLQLPQDCAEHAERDALGAAVPAGDTVLKRVFVTMTSPDHQDAVKAGCGMKKIDFDACDGGKVQYIS